MIIVRTWIKLDVQKKDPGIAMVGIFQVAMARTG